MQKKTFSVIILIFMMMFAESIFAQTAITVENMPAIPDNDGFAGSLAGVSNGALVVAGGSNFPGGGRPWDGSKKKWYDHILVLEKPNGTWKKAGKLPSPLGYAVSLTWKEGVVCVGGSNESGHEKKAFIMHWQKGEIVFEDLPDLPITIANGAGALLGNVLYIAGGLENPSDTCALKWVFSMDLSATKRHWTRLPEWEGEGRMLSVAASKDNLLYIMSGTSLSSNNKTGAVERAYLKELQCYNPKNNTWKRLANLPEAMVAAPGPAMVLNDQIFVLGGDNGESAKSGLSLKDNHPGFGNKIWQYSVKKDSWENTLSFPTDVRDNAALKPNESTYMPVTTPLVFWNGLYVLVGGEVRPGVRTPRVLSIKLK